MFTKQSPLQKYNTEINKLKDKPLLSDELVRIEDIRVPQEYFEAKTKRPKIMRAMRFFKENGILDKPITVIAETNERGKYNKLIVVDGLSRYIACRWLKIKVVPVRYIDIEDYEPRY